MFLTFSVTDTGPGMQPSELSRLFQRFSQIEPVFSIKAGGSGLVRVLGKGDFVCAALTDPYNPTGPVHLQATDDLDGR